MDRRESIAGVVLAAGTSSRMGRNKLLLELAGQSVLRRAVLTAVDSGLDPVQVVLNAEYQEGIHSSLRNGIRAVPGSCGAAVVLLADMPLVDAAMIRALVERYRAAGAPLVVSDYEGVDAPPIVYDRRLFPELGALEGEGCGKRVIKRHSAEAIRVPWPARALTDLDLPGDVERVRDQLGGAR
jgi:molybdenum cofactor cytidylyltransferase